MIAGRANRPSIVMWVVFDGEGGGQFDTERLVDHVKKLDPRPAGGQRQRLDGQGRRRCDRHAPLPPTAAMPKPEENRAAVLGEFGGLGLAIDGHTWTAKHWGYRGVEDTAHLTNAYAKMLSRLGIEGQGPEHGGIYPNDGRGNREQRVAYVRP